MRADIVADPTPYTPSYDFSEFQDSHPGETLPGVRVDIELANIATSIGSTSDAIKSVRRSDGALKNGIVTVDSLGIDVIGLLNAATVEIGSTTTLSPGSDATVVNTGDDHDAVLEFGIPAGIDGTDGDDGADGIDGAVWYAGTADPGSGLGKNGDFYLQSGTGVTGILGDVWEKTGGAWGKTTNIRGASGAGTGDVTGPAGATDGNLAAYNTSTGKLLKDSGKSISSFATAAQGATADAALPATSYTAADVLTKIKTVDGTGSGLDADLLDGHDTAYFLAASSNLSDLANAGTARTNLGLGTAATTTLDTDGTLAANSASRVPAQSAVKTYIDNAVTGLKWKASVRAATTANGTLATAFANGQTIDGVTLATGDRILLKNQTAGADNGLYTVNASGAPTRAVDADTAAEIKEAGVFVEEGTTNADTAWVLTNNGTITLGTTALTFAQFAGAGTYTATGGLGVTGNAFSITDAILNAFRGVSAAANKVAYFTGTSAMSVADLTAFGISLIGAANAAAVKTLLSLAKGDVGLGNVDNTADTGKPVSTAQQTALDLKANLASPTFTGTVAGISASMVGLGNVDNTSDATKNAAAVTLTNKRISARVSAITSSATPTPAGDTADQFEVTALAAGATFAAPTGTPTDGQKLIVRIKDAGTAEALAWNAIYRALGVALPTTTVVSKTLYVGFVYNAADAKWDCVASAQEA